jgi:hypothetical protein
MNSEQIERLHDQARNEMGFCVQAPDANWCDQHSALKFPGHEACRVLSVAYDVAELAGEVMEEMVRADLRVKVEGLQYEQIRTIGESVPLVEVVRRRTVLALVDGAHRDE